MLNSMCRWRLIAVLASAGVFAPAATLVCAETVFFDDFDGLTINSVWQEPLPVTLNDPGLEGGPYAYEGIPDHSFETLEGASVLRMTNMLGSETRRGWSTSETFPLSNFRYEVRFNTLSQDLTPNYEGLIEIWIIDALNPDRWDSLLLYGKPDYRGLFSMLSSVGGEDITLSIPYEENTWYRLVLEAKSDQVIHAMLLDDDGNFREKEVYNLHDFGDYTSGIRIGLSQVMLLPNSVSSPIDVAVDYVRLETNIVPEPSTLALFTVGALVALIKQRAPKRSSYSLCHSIRLIGAGDGGLVCLLLFIAANIFAHP